MAETENCDASDKTTRNCWDSEAFTTPPRFSTIRLNTQDKENDTMEEDVKYYLKKTYPGAEYQVWRHRLLPELLVVRAPAGQPPTPESRPLIVDALCGAAVLRGADVYAPAVLACPPDVQSGDVVAVYADLEGRCLRGRTQPYDGATVFVGNGVMEVSRRWLFTTDKPSGVAVRVTEPVYGAPSLGPLCGPRAMLQNLPSVVASRVLAPRPGELVLDMCAAPGGKTTHLAQLMENQGLLYAFDRTAVKAERIRSLAEQQGLSCVIALPADSTRILAADSRCQLRSRHLTGAPCPEHVDGPCLPPFAPDTFDRVMVDAPCSGLGQRPRLSAPGAGAASPKSEKQLASYPPLQHRLLSVGASLLRPGGRLVYSTCTTPPAENEQLVADVLSSRPEMRLQPAEPRLGGDGLPGHGLSEEQCRMVQRFVPQPDSDCCDRDTIGFFVACFTKEQS